MIKEKTKYNRISLPNIDGSLYNSENDEGDHLHFKIIKEFSKSI